MAKRKFTIGMENGRVSFNDATDGKQYLVLGVQEIHQNSLESIVVYGISQCLLDAGASEPTLTGKLAKMRDRAKKIVAGTYVRGQREASPLPMSAVFYACVELGKFADTAEKQAQWRKISEATRLNFAKMEDVRAKLAEVSPAAEDAEAELEAMMA